MLRIKTNTPYEVIKGDLISIVEDDSVTIRFKPPRRQLPSEKKIAWGDVIAVVGAEGEFGQLFVKSGAAVLLEGDGDFSGNTGTFGDADMIFNPVNAQVEIHIDKVEDASKPKPAKKTATKKTATRKASTKKTTRKPSRKK